MKIFRGRVVALSGFALAGAIAGFAQDRGNVMRPATPGSPVATHFIALETLDFRAIVPAPPAPGSLAAQTDLETVLQVQAGRTPEEVAWARLVEKDGVFNHASILGDWFKPDRLPMTAVLFKQVGDDLRAIDTAAKKPFLRPRPSTLDPKVQPCVTVPSSTSYPSGAATQSFVWAGLLADIFPAKGTELLARAHRAAWGRVIGGVHFPSDVVAGQLLAKIYLAECRKNARFKEAFEACKQELLRESAAAAAAANEPAPRKDSRK